MRHRTTNAFIPSIAMYNVLKRFGNAMLDLDNNIVMELMLIDDIVGEHAKYQEEIEANKMRR
jgi:hypothetical protein